MYKLTFIVNSYFSCLSSFYQRISYLASEPKFLLFQVTSCSHVFCKSCLIDFSSSMGQVSCPSCSKPLTVDFTGSRDNEDKVSKTTVHGFKQSSILNRIRLDDFQSSTKIDALVCWHPIYFSIGWDPVDLDSLYFKTSFLIACYLFEESFCL